MRPPLFRPLALLCLALAATGCGKSGGLDPSVVIPATGAPSALNYGRRVLNFEVGEAAAYPAPTVGGASSTFSIEPELPEGLTLNESTGAISGTPIAPLERTSFVVRATNGQGAVEQSVLIQVGGLTRFVYSPAEMGQSFRVYGTQADGAALFHHSWTEEFTQSVIQGNAEDSLRRTSASADGTVICGTTDFELICWVIDPVSGEFTAGPPVTLSTEIDLHSVAVHPTGNYVYVSTRTGKLVRSFGINQANGGLSQVASFDTGTQVNLIRVDPLGRYVLVRHVYQAQPLNYNQIRSFVVQEDGSGLVQTQIFTIPSVFARDMEIGALGEAVYFPLTLMVANQSQHVLQCRVNPGNGKLSLNGLVTAGTNPGIVRAAPNGRHLYVTDQDELNLNVYSLHGITRTMSLAHANVPISATIGDMSFSADGSEMYMTDTVRSEVVIQSLNGTTGAFEDSTVLHTRPGGLRLLQAPGETSPSLEATELYALNETGTHIQPFTVDPGDGSLVDGLTPTLVPAGTPRDLAVDPRGRFLYTGSRSPNALDGFSIGSNGELTDLLTPVNLNTAAPVALAIDPTGQFLQVACDTTLELRTYAIEETGELTLVDTEGLTGAPTALAVSPGGEFVYVTIGGDGSATEGSIQCFQDLEGSGQLTPAGTFDAAGYPNAIALNLSGTRAYVSLRETTGVKLFHVAEDGSLTPDTETNSQPMPNHVSLTDDGRFAYVTFIGPVSNSDGLLLYELDADTGELHGGEIGGQGTWADAAFAGDDCSQSLVSADGSQVYVLAAGGDEIWCFDTDPVNGRVTFKAIAQPGSDPVRMAFRKGPQAATAQP